MNNRERASECLAQLNPGTRAHLTRLNQAAPMLADLSQADVLVMVPSDEGQFVTVSHRRPVNATTLYPADQVGVSVTARTRPLIDIAYRTGEITDGGLWQDQYRRWIRTLAVPVTDDGEVVAVLAREFSPHINSVPGSLQFVAFQTLRRLARMITDGVYPPRVETRTHEHPPRVADGVILLDNRGAVEFASANAVTNLNLLGADRPPTGHRLRELGIEQNTIRSSYTELLPFSDEVAGGGHTMTLSCFPLIEHGGATGALVLLRDITEVRDRDRLLLTKDATITEIHHRVKNNLQTISSLLQLQSRRVESEEASLALKESVRRIQSIAVVHEMLSHRSGDELPFADIVRALVRNVRAAFLGPDSPLTFEVEATDDILPSDMSTTLAVVLSELLQNTIDHARATKVRVVLEASPTEICMSVTDDGVGFGADFSIDACDGLGLTIVRTLVTSELNGSINILSGHDTVSDCLNENSVVLTVPRHDARPR